MGRGCSSDILKRTCKRDQSGRGSSYFRPLKDTKILKRRLYLYISPCVTLNETNTATNIFVMPEVPKGRPKSEIHTPKRDDKHPRHFQKRSPPPPPRDGEMHCMSEVCYPRTQPTLSCSIRSPAH